MIFVNDALNSDQENFPIRLETFVIRYGGRFVIEMKKLTHNMKIIIKFCLGLFIFFIFSIQNVGADEEFLCIPDYVNGYTMNEINGKWEPAQFDVKGIKYILKKHENKWFWNEFGESKYTPQNQCENDFNEMGFLKCELFVGGEVLINRNTLRYQRISDIGYVIADRAIEKELPQDPFYEIGVCSPL